MTRALVHRGPDAFQTSFYSNPHFNLGFGHQRLAIRDLSSQGIQPMASANGNTVIVYNGEIYNDNQLKDWLKTGYGIHTKTKCDTEALVELLEHEGIDSIEKLNGMFAFAAYNARKMEFILARDAIGIKPLYIYQNKSRGFIAFASETKAFLSLRYFERKISIEAVGSLLAQGYVGAHKSLMEDVISLPPGEVLKIDRYGQMKTFRPENNQSHEMSFADVNSHADAAHFLKPHFEKAIEAQRVSDAPLGIWQSGGVDSSLINAATQSPKPTALIFSTGADDYDESKDAQIAASHVGSPFRLISADHRIDAQEMFQKIVWHLDGEIADSSALAVYLLSQASSKVAKVVLSGDGADELFGGYFTYNATRLASWFGHLAKFAPTQYFAQLLANIEANDERRYPKFELLSRLVQGIPNKEYAHVEWRRYAMPWHLSSLCMPEFRTQLEDGLADYVRSIENGREIYGGNDAAVWGQHADIKHYLPGDMLIKTDRMSMAHGVEVRVPFLDKEFREAAAKIPLKFKLPTGNHTKPILRELLNLYGFSDDISKRSKTGFNMPIAQLLRGDYKSVMIDLLYDQDLLMPYFDPSAVAQLVIEHIRGRQNNSYIIWTLMTLAQWRKLLSR